MTDRTKVFAYKGVLGAIVSPGGKFLNDPRAEGQLGCVIDSRDVEITPEAKRLLRQAPRQGGSFASIMLTRHADGSGSSLGLLGFGYVMYHGEDLAIGRDCDLSVLDDMVEIEIDLPKGFRIVVDKMMEKNDVTT